MVWYYLENMSRLAKAPFPAGVEFMKIAIIAMLVAGCTDASLYHRSRSPAQADRVTFRGEVCTEDPMINHFPMKVVLLVDQSDGVNPAVGGVTTG